MIYKISNEHDIVKIFELIDVDKVGSAIMSKKAKLNIFFIKNLSIKAANILKQDALSIGAELATSRHTADFSAETTDAVLICNDKQLEVLAKKELIQPFGLKKIAQKLQNFRCQSSYEKKLMGVLNINSDSFFSGSRIDEGYFLDKALQMIDEGANILDIGAVSSRPGSVYPGEKEELLRIEPVLKSVARYKLFEKVDFSIDTFSPAVARIALDSGFRIINDITGLESDELADIIGRYNATVILMHKKGETQNMQELPKYDDVMIEVDEFFTERISKAHSFGVKSLILDVGIGFGKSLAHNLSLVKNLEHFTHFNYPLLIGASRKSMIHSIYSSEVEDRLPGTLALHQKALDNGTTILRVHDVKEHAQMLAVWKKLKESI